MLDTSHGKYMGAHICCFMSVAGPSTVVADYHATLMKARRHWPQKGWHWNFGLCDPQGVEPIINDPRLEADVRPPGESYMLMTGIWLGRDWSSANVGVAMNTISSLWPDLTIFFDGHPYEDYRGIRGLWANGECIVFELRVDEENPDRDENGEPITVYRQVHPTAQRPIPRFYQHDFTSNDSAPSWDEVRKCLVPLKCPKIEQ